MSLFDLSAEVLALSGNTLSVSRLAAQSFDANGRLIAPSVASTLTVVASVQPMTSDDTKRLPEGLRNRSGVSVWCVTELRGADVTAGIPGDTFTFDGRTFEVTSAERWADLGNFWKHLCVQVER